MTTIKLKNGSGAPTAGDLVQGEPALDLTNKRLYTEDSGGTVIEVGTNPGTDVTFADNRKAIFGAGSDLQIYHDGSNSIITDQGTGNLKINASSFEVNNFNDTQNILDGNAAGAVKLYHAGSQKLTTTSTGIDVTGKIETDGINAANFISTGSTYVDIGNGTITGRLQTSGTNLNIGTATTGASLNLKRGNGVTAIKASSVGDISFYEDTGTTAKLFWDASAESLGIGTSSVAGALHVEKGNNYSGADFEDNPHLLISNGTPTNHTAVLMFQSSGADVANKRSGITGGNYYSNKHGLSFLGDLSGKDRTATPDMFIDSDGNVGIGTSSPSNLVHLQSSLDTLLKIESTDTVVRLDLTDSGGTSLIQNTSGKLVLQADNANTAANTYLGFEVDGSEAMRIDSSGNVGIGTSSPNQDLELNKDNANVNLNIRSSNTGNATVLFGDQGDASAGSVTYDNNVNEMIFKVNNQQEAMRIDSSGNLLVAKTSAAIGTAGVQLEAAGSIAATRSGGNTARFNRLTNDGDIVQFMKDGSVVGSINSWSQSGTSRIGFVNNDSNGLGIYRSNSTSVKIVPLKAGVLDDGTAVDLGNTNARFKDLYLSGGVYLGGTGSANLLDDYEEGTWTPAPTSGTLNAGATGSYVKIGSLVHVQGQLSFSANGTTNRIDGLPFRPRIEATLSSARQRFLIYSDSTTAIYGYCQDVNNALHFQNEDRTAHDFDTADGVYTFAFTYET